MEHVSILKSSVYKKNSEIENYIGWSIRIMLMLRYMNMMLMLWRTATLMFALFIYHFKQKCFLNL